MTIGFRATGPLPSGRNAGPFRQLRRALLRGVGAAVAIGDRRRSWAASPVATTLFITPAQAVRNLFRQP